MGRAVMPHYGHASGDKHHSKKGTAKNIAFHDEFRVKFVL
jgi:hypothetical protein